MTRIISILLVGLSLQLSALPLPEFSLADLNTQQTVSNQSLLGQVVYVDFWQSTCAPCKVSFPQLNALRNELHDQGFEVLAVSLDRKQKDAERFLRKLPVDYLVVHNADRAIGDYFRQNYPEFDTLPFAFIIDREGQVHSFHRGFVEGDIEDIRAVVQSLL